MCKPYNDNSSQKRLERVAEELMERMKWKHYQEPLRTRTCTNHKAELPAEASVTAEVSPTAAVATNQVAPFAASQTSDGQNARLYDLAYEHRISQPQTSSVKAQPNNNITITGHNTTGYTAENEVNAGQRKQNTQQRECEDNLTAEEKGEAQSVADNTKTSPNSNQLHQNNYNSSLISKKFKTNDISNTTSTATTNLSHATTQSNITDDRANNTETGTSLLPLKEPSEHVEPIDWRPNEKCYFCVDGRLLTVNSKGELVAEPAGPAVSAAGGDSAEHGHMQLETDSDSNESSHLNLVNSTTAAAVSPVIPNSNISNSSTNNNTNRINWNKLLTTRLRDLPANMTSMDSMAAQLAVISGYPNLNWLQLMQQQQLPPQQQQQINSATPTTSETSAAAVSPPLKDSPSPSDATGEQPLDLSSKPSPNPSISGDLKAVRTKALRNASTHSARRPYTDDALNSAVQGILGGKCNARKPPDQYNSAASSTLRNRSSRIAMSSKRAQLSSALNVDKVLSGEEFGVSGISGADYSTRRILSGHDSNASTPQPDATGNPALEELANRLGATHSLRKLCVNNGSADAVGRDIDSDAANCTNLSPKSNAMYADAAKRDTGTPPTSTTPQQSPQAQLGSMFAENVLFQALLLTVTSFGALQQRMDQPITWRDLVANLKDMLEARTTGDLNVESLLNNGKPTVTDQPLLLQKLQQQQTSPYTEQCIPKSDTPETTCSLEAHEAIGDNLPTSILKIPSYKPAAGSTTPSTGAPRTSCSPSLLCSNNANSMPNRNGNSPHSAPSPRIANSMLAAAVATANNNGTSASGGHQSNDISVISPPLLQHRQIGGNTRDSQSPPSFSFRDVIARGIHRTMNEQATQDAHAAAAAVAAASAPMLGLCLEMERSVNNSSSADYKKPTISVVKNIGGTDTTRFGAAPNLLSSASTAGAPGSGANIHNSHGYHQSHLHSAHHHHPHHLSRQEAAALAAGKGTRPKRGKYRNYDRDSLIEAVRAVQRGEMSVHRAGSYFGVPHSTLEYKVKERHLMRPRKREPKPQPGIDGSSSSTTGKSNSNIPGHHNNLNKMKLGGGVGSGVANSKLSETLKGNSNAAAVTAAATAAFPSATPNGMKIPIFDPLQYPAHLFWQHPPATAFSQMQMEFNRNALAAQSANAASTVHRYTEESLRSVASAGTPSNTNSPSPIGSPLPAATGHVLNIKSAREIAENLYDSGGANGSSILDGIIRKTLDRKSVDVGPPPAVTSGGALLDQLLIKKSTLPTYEPNNSSHNNNEYRAGSTMGAAKRAGSPLPYTEIKRERSSPPHTSDDDDAASRSGAEEASYEHNNNSKSSVSANSEQQHQQRSHSRLPSHDSETDASSIRSELIQNHNNTSKLATDLNGSGVSASGIVPKMEPLSGLGGTPAMGCTSILQEKLAQIKAEQENEQNL